MNLTSLYFELKFFLGTSYWEGFCIQIWGTYQYVAGILWAEYLYFFNTIIKFWWALLEWEIEKQIHLQSWVQALELQSVLKSPGDKCILPVSVHKEVLSFLRSRLYWKLHECLVASSWYIHYVKKTKPDDYWGWVWCGSSAQWVEEDSFVVVVVVFYFIEI